MNLTAHVVQLESLWSLKALLKWAYQIRIYFFPIAAFCLCDLHMT